MQTLVGFFLVVGLVAPPADRAHRRDQLFAAWQRAQRGARSLVVRFTLETREPTFDQRKKFEGSFRLIRTPKGEVFASYELTPAPKNEGSQERWGGLLHNRTVYLLHPDEKTAIRFGPVEGDLRPFLEQYFNPFVRLLDRKRAEAKWRLELVKQDGKQDEWYTILAVKPKQVKRWGWLPDRLQEGRVVLMNKASEGVPKDMPRQFWYTDGSQEYTFEIKSWRLNGADAPKPEEFARPEDRPGWEVSAWPFRSK